jgi:hypothetical protein
MNKLLTKRNVIVTSFGSILLVVLIALLDANNLLSCRYYDETGHAMKYCERISFAFIPLILLLPLSFVTFFLRDEIFDSWIRFAKWYVPIAMFAILISPEDTGGFLPLPVQGTIALASSGLFLVISLIFIAYKFLTLKKGGVGE